MLVGAAAVVGPASIEVIEIGWLGWVGLRGRTSWITIMWLMLLVQSYGHREVGGAGFA